ncbi:MAG: hypothetical protein ACYSWQ_20755 [Planctomycetota bacterium]
MQERNGIPKFDLAEQIMSEHRKNASVKRKGPAKTVRSPKRELKVDPVGRAAEQHLMPVGQEQVIADIVARDIERLCSSRD